ncbi:MAG: DUF418 domain-containing protein [Sphingobacteriia bacterium]|nr:MAG: DUF418 domain-containing protein [Sphingobacteriia bacterium]
MRGFVLCGILLMNITGFGLYGSYSNPTVSGGSTGWDLYTWITTNMVFEGTMRALFSLLFGVGTYIILDRLTKSHAGIKAADIYFRRLMWMIVFGLIHGYLLLWTGEILFDYAIMGMLLYSFRNLAPKTLVWIALLFFCIGAFWTYTEYKEDQKLVADVAIAKTYTAQGKELTKELKAATARWEKIEEKKSPKAVAEANEKMRKGYFSLVAHLAPYNKETDTIWVYRFDLWDVLSMMLLGIAFYKWNLFSGQKSYRFYGLMVLFGYAIGLSTNYYEVTSLMNDNFSFLAFSKANITYDLGRVPMAIGHIGLIMIFTKLPILGWLKLRLAAVGKMALSNYIMHSLICMIIFTGVGFGLFGKLHRHELYYIVFAIWIFQLILSPIWLTYFHFGPMEWLWRRLSYQYKPPFRK